MKIKHGFQYIQVILRVYGIPMTVATLGFVKNPQIITKVAHSQILFISGMKIMDGVKAILLVDILKCIPQQTAELTGKESLKKIYLILYLESLASLDTMMLSEILSGGELQMHILYVSLDQKIEDTPGKHSKFHLMLAHILMSVSKMKTMA